MKLNSQNKGLYFNGKGISMLYINKELNSLVFTQEEFKINRDYMPDFFMAIGELNPKKKIRIAIDLDETPVLFVLYFRKLMQESQGDFEIFYKDKGEPLRTSLKDYGMPYKNIKKYPFPLPAPAPAPKQK